MFWNSLIVSNQNKLKTWFKSMKLSFKESLFLIDVKSYVSFLSFLFFLDISFLTNLIWHCLYAVECLKSLLEIRNWTNFCMVLFWKQASKKLIPSNTFLYLKSSFSTSIPFLTMAPPYLFRKNVMADKCLGKRRHTWQENMIDTPFRNMYES